MVKTAAALALLSAAVMCGTVSYSLVTTSKHLSNTLMKLNDEIDEAHRATLELALTAMEARKASVKESLYLDQWNTQIGRLIASANYTLEETSVTIASMRSVSDVSVSTLQATQQTVTSLQAPITSANQALTAATASINHLDVLLQDPHLAATIAHTNSTMTNVDATTADVQQAVHSYLHPTWPQRILGWIKSGVVTVGQILY